MLGSAVDCEPAARRESIGPGASPGVLSMYSRRSDTPPIDECLKKFEIFLTDILHIGEALLKVDPLQPAQVVGLIHCGLTEVQSECGTPYKILLII